MLKLNLRKLAADRGFSSPNQLLIKSGFTYYTATRLVNNTIDSISFPHIEKLCLALNCTINDLFVWSKPANIIIPENHPLHQLIPKSGSSLSDHLKTLPLSQLEEVKNFIATLPSTTQAIEPLSN